MGTLQKAYINGNIYTCDKDNPKAEAVGVIDGKFAYVGSNEGIKGLIADDTEVVDLDGQFVIAGITDAHCHVYGATLSSMLLADLTPGENVEDYIQIIKDYVAAHPDDDDYRGRGWLNGYFPNLCPTADILDAISPDKPVSIRSIDGHSLWVNTCLLKLAGITADTPDPDGGKIEHYPNGEPNGCLRDTAMPLAQKALSDYSVDQYKRVVMGAQELYASLGYTSYYEAMINENYKVNLHKAYKELSDEGKLLLHTYSTYNIMPGEDSLDKVDVAKQWHDDTTEGMYQLTDVKLFIDGVVEGGTVLLKQPYATDPNYYGTDRWPGEENEKLLAAVVEKSNRLGLPTHFHAIGDGACFKAVNAIEAAQKATGDYSLRNAITHLQVVDPEEIRRMADQKIIAVFNPWCNKAKGYFEEVEVYYLGRERAENEYPVKSFLDAGVKCSFGTDFPMSPLCYPFESMEVFVTRMSEGDEATLLKPSERIDIETIIDIMTNGTAYQFHKEATSGSITVGKDADMVVLSQNLLEIPSTEIRKTVPLKTIVNGKVVYEKQ